MGHDRGTGREFARMLAENERYTEAFDRSALTASPLTGLAILTCMDARLDVEETLGLRTGDAHIIRNAGGIVTDDVIRSLVVSQQVGGTTEIVVIGHTRCGLLGMDDAVMRARLADRLGPDVPAATFETGAFADLEDRIGESVATLRSHPLLERVPVHGLVFDVATGRLREIDRLGDAAAMSGEHDGMRIQP